LIFIDSHCHLNLLDEDLIEVISRALDSDVTKIIVPGINLESSIKAVEIAERFPQVYAAVGIHPHEVEKIKPRDIEFLKNLATHSKVVAIGEIGLDYHYLPYNSQLQHEILTSMLDLSLQVEKPIILHSRDSLSELIDVISSFQYSKGNDPEINPLSGVFHMFEGNWNKAISVTKMGFFYSIGGNITFKNNQKGKEIIEECGIEKLLLETDSPFISPHPHRGMPNEPARIPIIAAKIAEILQTRVELVAEVTTRNAISLFKLDS
jgi:TatD DNase family protein